MPPEPRCWHQARAPEPAVEFDESQFTPSLVNNAELAGKFVPLFRQLLGNDCVHERPMSLGGEDFSRYILAGVPGFYYHLGSAPPEKVAAAQAGGGWNPPGKRSSSSAR